MIPLLGSGELPSFPIAPKGLRFILDNTAHASLQILRGLMGQFGVVLREDFQSLERLRIICEIVHEEGRIPLLIADSVGSMGGLAPVGEMMQLAERMVPLFSASTGRDMSSTPWGVYFTRD